MAAWPQSCLPLCLCGCWCTQEEEKDKHIPSPDCNWGRTGLISTKAQEAAGSSAMGNARGQYLEDIFSACLESDCEVVIQVISAYSVGMVRESSKRQRGILVKLPSWQVKYKILENIWENSGLEIEGSAVSVYPGLSTITLKKRRHFQFFNYCIETQGAEEPVGNPF